MAGTAAKPYTYRTLLPTLARTIAPVLNRETSLAVGMQAEAVLGKRSFRRDLDGKRYPGEVLVILVIMYLSLLGLAFVVQRLLRDLGYPRDIQYGMPVLLLAGCVLFMNFGYIYDFTALFLFSAGCLLIQHQNWPAFLLVFAGATLNKETSIFLAAVLVLVHFRRLPFRQLALVVAAQVGIYGLLQGVIRYSFRANAGSFMLDGFAVQMAALRETAVDRPLALLWSSMLVLILLGGIAHGWHEKPRVLKTGLGLLPIFLGLYLVGGYPSEIRVFLEVYPLIAILVLPPPPHIQAIPSTIQDPAAPPGHAS